MMVCGDVSSVTKRTELLRRLVACLENAGYSSGNVFRPSNITVVSSERVPMQRSSARDVVLSTVRSSAVQPPFPYPVKYTSGEIVETQPRV